MEYSLEQKIACLSRVVKIRRRVHARQVAKGRMDAAKAEARTGVMAAVLADYRSQWDAAQPSLFDL